MEYGFAKLSKGPENFATILHALSIPAPHFMAWLTILTELIGGLAVLLGAFVTLVSLPLAGLLFVAIFTVHLPERVRRVLDASGKAVWTSPRVIAVDADPMQNSKLGRSGAKPWRDCAAGLDTCVVLLAAVVPNPTTESKVVGAWRVCGWPGSRTYRCARNLLATSRVASAAGRLRPNALVSNELATFSNAGDLEPVRS
jgi:uncharacterized membrane protein YphA (DoxX/SURF4 family)